MSSKQPIGIDFGTTLSTVATVNDKGEVVTLKNASGAWLTPSAVFFGDSISIGDEALRLGAAAPEQLAEEFKREMGEAHYRERVRDYWVPPEVLAAFVLKKLASDAEAQVGPLGKSVITVPAYFDEPRRQATLRAGRLAGLDVASIINEPTAAAVSHFCGDLKATSEEGFQFARKHVLVYDLGGGTFDVSLLKAEGNHLTILGTDGDVTLGGRDFDHQLVQHIAERFLDEKGVDPRSERQAARALWQTAQDVKHALSKEEHTVAVCRFADLRLGVEITRTQFEELIEHYLERTLTTCREALAAADMDWGGLDEVLLVGGSSRIPAIQRRIEEESGVEPTLIPSPDEAVAHGAAIFAATQHGGGLPDLEIINVNSHSLGVAGVDVETQQPVNKIIIRRNTPLPASSTQKFVTRRPNQDRVSVTLLEGESETPRYCSKVAECVVELEHNLPERTEVVVTIRYSTDGTIAVSAQVPLTRQSAHVEVTRPLANELDPLEVWESRLIKGEEPEQGGSTPQREPDRVDPSNAGREEVLARADHLMRLLGRQYLSSTVPVTAVPAQRAALEAEKELQIASWLLKTIDAQLGRTTYRDASVALQQDVSALRAHIRSLESFREHLLLSLGRECSQCAVFPPELKETHDELKGLSAALAAAR